MVEINRAAQFVAFGIGHNDATHPLQAQGRICPAQIVRIWCKYTKYHVVLVIISLNRTQRVRQSGQTVCLCRYVWAAGCPLCVISCVLQHHDAGGVLTINHILAGGVQAACYYSWKSSLHTAFYITLSKYAANVSGVTKVS